MCAQYKQNTGVLTSMYSLQGTVRSPEIHRSPHTTQVFNRNDIFFLWHSETKSVFIHFPSFSVLLCQIIDTFWRKPNIQGQYKDATLDHNSASGVSKHRVKGIHPTKVHSPSQDPHTYVRTYHSLSHSHLQSIHWPKHAPGECMHPGEYANCVIWTGDHLAPIHFDASTNVNVIHKLLNIHAHTYQYNRRKYSQKNENMIYLSLSLSHSLCDSCTQTHTHSSCSDGPSIYS